MHNKVLLPDGWTRPRGYSNAMIGRGQLITVGGQIGWTEDEVFEALDFAGQWRQTLQNIRSVLAAGGATPKHLTQMTIYVTDMAAYRSSLSELGAIWREEFGKCFPSMALVGVTTLVEPEALVEMSALAIIPDEEG